MLWVVFVLYAVAWVEALEPIDCVCNSEIVLPSVLDATKADVFVETDIDTKADRVGDTFTGTVLFATGADLITTLRPQPISGLSYTPVYKLEQNGGTFSYLSGSLTGIDVSNAGCGAAPTFTITSSGGTWTTSLIINPTTIIPPTPGYYLVMYSYDAEQGANDVSIATQIIDNFPLQLPIQLSVDSDVSVKALRDGNIALTAIVRVNNPGDTIGIRRSSTGPRCVPEQILNISTECICGEEIAGWRDIAATKANISVVAELALKADRAGDTFTGPVTFNAGLQLTDQGSLRLASGDPRTVYYHVRYTGTSAIDNNLREMFDNDFGCNSRTVVQKQSPGWSNSEGSLVTVPIAGYYVVTYNIVTPVDAINAFPDGSGFRRTLRISIQDNGATIHDVQRRFERSHQQSITVNQLVYVDSPGHTIHVRRSYILGEAIPACVNAESLTIVRVA